MTNTTVSYGQAIRQDVVEKLVRDNLNKAIEQEKLQPANIENVETTNDKPGEDLQFEVVK